MTVTDSRRWDFPLLLHCKNKEQVLLIPAQLGALSIALFSIPAGSNAQSVVKVVACVNIR